MFVKRVRQRGDTLIEVLFAVSVFSLIVVSALAIMNQGSAAAERALEITLVRQQMDGQAETLRFMHDSYVAVYKPGLTFDLTDDTTSPAEEWYETVTKSPVPQATNFGSGATCPDFPSKAFIIDTNDLTYRAAPSDFKPASTFAQVTFDKTNKFTASEGLWIEAVRSTQSEDQKQSNTGYIDFHIRACWDTSGLGVPMTLGTIVRLYEPRG
jgi:type II secretory pathway pseudopilin PulG